MSVDVYMIFNGNSREAVKFYAQVFETEPPKMINFQDAPPNPEFTLPEEAKNLVMHTRLTISGSNVMFSDTFPGSPFVVGNNISLALVSKNLEEINSSFLINLKKAELYVWNFKEHSGANAMEV